MSDQQMVYDTASGQWVPMGTPPVQQAPQYVQQPPQQQAPMYQQQAQAQPPVNIFANGGASTALSWLQDDDEHSSMDDVGGDSVPTIKMNDMGWLVKRIDGIDLPPVPSIDMVIIGVGPKGGGVYRTYFGTTYNKNETVKPICVSYDGKTPSVASSQAVQCSSCDLCPHNVKGTGPNDSKACKYAMHFAVVDVNDPNRIYRVKMSATPLFNKQIDPQGYHTIPTYKTFLQQHGVTWEKVITRLSCPYGKNGGFRLNATGFITPEFHNRIKELKQMISLNLIVDLNAAQQNEQLQLAVNGQHVAQIPVAQLPVQPAQTVQPVVQQVVQPAAPVVQPTPAPVSMKEQWASHPTLPAEVKAWILNPQVTETMAHDYLAANYNHVFAPVAPAAPVVPPAPVAPAAPVAPTAPVQPVAAPAPTAPAAVQQPVAPSAPVVQSVPTTPPADPAAQPNPTTPPQAMSAPVVQATPNAVVDNVINDLLGGSDIQVL